MNFKKCGCKWCRVSMRCRKKSLMMTQLRRAARHQSKIDLRMGREPEKFIRVPYLY